MVRGLSGAAGRIERASDLGVARETFSTPSWENIYRKRWSSEKRRGGGGGGGGGDGDGSVHYVTV